MPRAPHTARRLDGLGASVFEQFSPLIAQLERRPAKLHIGDSHELPLYPMPLDATFLAKSRHWFQYPNTRGVRTLREALAIYHVEAHGLKTEAAEILVCAGATNGLAAIVQAIVDPGDEVIVPTPSWPFFRGMVQMAEGKVRQVPLYYDLYGSPRLDVVERVERAITDRSVALYLNSPNNPTGKMLDRDQCARLLELAAKHQLWVISDEAYDGMAFDGRDTPPLIESSPSPEHVFSTYTFSKIHRLAGARLGWVRAQADLIDIVDRALVHMVYSASSMAQEMVIDAVKSRGEWAPTVRSELEQRRDLFVRELDLPMSLPEGTYFAFIETTPYLDAQRSQSALVEECIRAGVMVTPGADFGSDWSSYLRICFASESVESVRAAARILRGVLTRNS